MPLLRIIDLDIQPPLHQLHRVLNEQVVLPDKQTYLADITTFTNIKDLNYTRCLGEYRSSRSRIGARANRYATFLS